MRRRKREVCQISEEAFDVPASYRQLNKWSGTMADQEEEMLQLAIRQSLMEQTGGTITQEKDVSFEIEHFEIYCIIYSGHNDYERSTQ